MFLKCWQASPPHNHHPTFTTQIKKLKAFLKLVVKGGSSEDGKNKSEYYLIYNILFILRFIIQ
jgi:hypothetical protein